MSTTGDTEIAKRTWPGPECLRTDKERDARRYTAMVLDGYSPSHAYAIIMDERAEKRREAERRTRGIGEGRALARRRMERFLAWMRGSGRHVYASWASEHMSPEAAVMEAARGAWLWPFYVTSESWARRCMVRPKGRDRLVVELLASSEWHSLPWQRDPEDVTP